MSLYVNITKKLGDMTLRVSFGTSDDDGITGILGASGCGKSMTLKCIAGIAVPDSGQIVLNGRVLYDSEKKINLRAQERKVGYLFQNYALFPHMTALENVEMAIPGRGREKREQALGYMRLFHAEELAGQYPARMSGGQQQRVALARIMASRPDVLMLDEPFSALDYYLKEKIQLELSEELKGYHGDVLLVTHNRDEIYRLCARIHVLCDGRLVTSGGVKEVFREPETVAAAKLTGCKNIEKIEVTGPHSFYVPGWGLHMQMAQEVPADAPYIGIRAHYLRRAGAGEETNVLACRCKKLIEDPFEVVLILDNGIWWKIPKDIWKREFHEEAPDRLAVPENSIFFLKDC